MGASQGGSPEPDVSDFLLQSRKHYTKVSILSTISSKVVQLVVCPATHTQQSAFCTSQDSCDHCRSVKTNIRIEKACKVTLNLLTVALCGRCVPASCRADATRQIFPSACICRCSPSFPRFGLGFHFSTHFSVCHPLPHFRDVPKQCLVSPANSTILIVPQQCGHAYETTTYSSSLEASVKLRNSLHCDMRPAISNHTLVPTLSFFQLLQPLFCVKLTSGGKRCL